jgi:phosphinothricin acetyltransferase
MGFARVGTFRRCGYKFGRWYNMIWMEKLLGEHRPDPTPVDHNRQR